MPLDLVTRRRRRHADYRETFGTDAGKRVLVDLMKKGHIGEPVTVMNDDKRVDPYMSAFRDGSRSGVLEICRILNMSDAEIMRQVQEKVEDE